MSLRINAENYTNAALRFCVYVGGVSVSSKPDQVLSLAWATSPFPAVGEGNQPGKTSVSWEQTYGFTVLSKGNAGQASWSASVENNGHALGKATTVSYDKNTETFRFSAPVAIPDAKDRLRFILDASVPIGQVGGPHTIGVNINGTPAAACPPEWVTPNVTLDFIVNPVFMVAAANQINKGQEISIGISIGSKKIEFLGGMVERNVKLSPDNTWDYK